MLKRKYLFYISGHAVIKRDGLGYLTDCSRFKCCQFRKEAHTQAECIAADRVSKKHIY